MLYGRLVHVRETLTDLQVWAMRLARSRAPPGPAVEL